MDRKELEKKRDELIKEVDKEEGDVAGLDFGYGFNACTDLLWPEIERLGIELQIEKDKDLMQDLALVEELEKRDARIEKLRAVLGFYANVDKYGAQLKNKSVYNSKARAALEGDKSE